VEGVAIDENREKSRVYFGVIGDFADLVIGEVGGVLLFVSGHNRDGFTQLFHFAGGGAGQHTQLAETFVILELLADNSAIFVACKLREFFEVLSD
jgi:hypothetical protein